ncbi:FAD-dependent oxidoreductase, partial [Streptomyces chartreusis]
MHTTGPNSRPRPTRRTLLKAAGAAAVATPALTPVASAATRVAEAADWDVVVIGAGFAGITAARELRARGKRVLVLE